LGHEISLFDIVCFIGFGADNADAANRDAAAIHDAAAPSGASSGVECGGAR
jgi:hypothetical protein